MVALNKNLMSLTVGRQEKLIATPTEGVVWSSNNENVTVDQEGNIFAVVDALRLDEPSGQAIITATLGGESDTCKITIVPWAANRIALSLIGHIPNYQLFKGNDGVLYGFLDTAVYNLETMQQIGTLPRAARNNPVLVTPLGYFYMSTLREIYHSVDMQTWTLSFTPTQGGLYHAFAYHYDEIAETVYIYSGEYTNATDYRHKVYRGAVTADTQTWTTILEFYSLDEYAADPINNVPTCRHVHVVDIDPYTGDVWVNTGDVDEQVGWYHSEDNGDTFRKIGGDTQAFRSLSVWFTEKYIYWNMDTSAPQSLYRLKRTDLSAQTPENNLTEKIIELVNGSHWYYCWAKYENRDVVLMCQAVEGQRRDWNGRVFMIEELPDETVDVQEVYIVPSATPDVYVPYVMLEPKQQDDDGYIYFKGRDTEHDGLWKMQLEAIEDDPVELSTSISTPVYRTSSLGGFSLGAAAVGGTRGETTRLFSGSSLTISDSMALLALDSIYILLAGDSSTITDEQSTVSVLLSFTGESLTETVSTATVDLDSIYLILSGSSSTETDDQGAMSLLLTLAGESLTESAATGLLSSLLLMSGTSETVTDSEGNLHLTISFTGESVTEAGGQGEIVLGIMVELEFTGAFAPGDIVKINSKTLEATLNNENALHLVNGDFPMIRPGEQTLVYADEEDARQIRVKIKWQDRWL